MRLSALSFLAFVSFVHSNEDAKRLYDDLMVNYNRHRRPSEGHAKQMNIQLRLRLSQIIDVHEIDQVMTCSVWLKQVWMDRALSWNPSNYGGVSVLYVPYEMIWVPDIVLYNKYLFPSTSASVTLIFSLSADSNYNITISTKATLHYTGQVTWEPPAIFKSVCTIDVKWFPFDTQICELKFGSWTYTENLLNLELMEQNVHYEIKKNEFGLEENVTKAMDGIDLSDYYPSVEWDIMSRNATRRSKKYPSCCAGKAYIDITYTLELKRKPLFYTVNLVFPCLGISFLTILVFYLPSHSGEKIQLCISILVALTIFFLLLVDIIPSSSVTLPLIGKYLLFTMITVTLSVIITVGVLNIHHRSPTTHSMPPWVKTVFLHTLPRILLMRRPLKDGEESFRRVSSKRSPIGPTTVDGKIPLCYHEHRLSKDRHHGPPRDEMAQRIQKLYYSSQALQAFDNVCFIADILKRRDRDDKMDEDWKFVAMVLDRLFLLIFSVACLVGACFILLQAPAFYERRDPINHLAVPTTTTAPSIGSRI